MLRYGMNPHQQARMDAGPNPPVALLNGEASLINWLDLLNAWQLVRDARAALGLPVAASFKHVSPAGVATAGPIDEAAARIWAVDAAGASPILSAYVRARDADPKSSFGDVIALSEPCDLPTARFLSRVICDAVIAPDYEPGTLERLATKKQGRFLIAQIDPGYQPPEWEHRTVFGIQLSQQRDTAPLTGLRLPGESRLDALLGLATLRYTQSNSVCVGTSGMILGIGAGQQNRVDCTRLAASKARTWWLRRHDLVQNLHHEGMRRQDLINWQVRFAEASLTGSQEHQLTQLFGTTTLEAYRDPAWRTEWLRQEPGLVLCSDGFLPFADNVEVAAEYGVTTIIEPGGSTRTTEVHTACDQHGITHHTTGLRLFHH